MHAQSVGKSPPEAIWAAASSAEYGPKCWPSLLTVICMVNIAEFWFALSEWLFKVNRLYATALDSNGESELCGISMLVSRRLAKATLALSITVL